METPGVRHDRSASRGSGDDGLEAPFAISRAPGCINQVEIYFSILQRKAIATGDFADLDHLGDRILGFQDRYNHAAKPFDWTYTREDLNRFLARLNPDGTLPTGRMTPDEPSAMTTSIDTNSGGAGWWCR